MLPGFNGSFKGMHESKRLRTTDVYRVNIKKQSHTTFVDISAMREVFYMKFYRTVKQSNIHFITKFG